MKDIGIYVVLMGLFLLGCTSDKTSTETQPAESEIVQEEDSDPSPISSEAKDSKETSEEVVPNDATEEVDGEVVEESPVNVRKLEDEADLPGGIGAQSRLNGAWIVENDVARFYIQDTGVSTGLDLYGGNVIDGVLLSNGQAGPDLFRETFPLVGLKVPTADKIEIITDSDGHQALIVKGTDALSQVVDLLDQLVAGAAGLEIETEYGMIPGVPALRMRTRVRWPEGATKNTLLFGELMAFGRYQKMFTEEGGYGDASELALMRTLATRADGASYGLCMTSGNFSLLGSDAGNTATVYNEVPGEDDDGWIRLERWLIVGDGSPASVLAVAHDLQERDVHTLTGVVSDWGSFDGVSGAQVTAYRQSDKGPVAVNQGITDELGIFAMTLEAGEYSLVASTQDRERGDAIKLLVEKDLDVELDISPPARIRMDLDGPTRITLQGVKVMPMDAFLGEFSEGGFDRLLYGVTGKESFTIRPGEYGATISRGPEFSIVEETISVQSGEEWVFSESPVRQVESPGWVGGDFHQHTVFSLDSNMPVRTKLIENVVEGVDVAVTTDHDNLSDYGPYVKELGLQDRVFTMVGEEISYTGVGHFNAFPLGQSEEDPYAMIGAQFWAGKEPNQLMLDVLELWPDAILQVNHPRSGLSAYYGWLKLDPQTGEVGAEGRTLSKIPVAVEVNDDFVDPEFLTDPSEEDLESLAPDDVPAMLDWLNLVQSGYPITAVSNSDSHNYGSGTGYPRSYLFVGENDDTSVMKPNHVLDAIRGQQVVMSRGILAWPEVDGKMMMGTDAPVTVNEKGKLEVRFQIRAPSWVQVNGVSVLKEKEPVRLSYLDGKVVPYEMGTTMWNTVQPEEGKPFSGEVVFEFTLEESTHLIFMVSGVAKNSKIFGTNAFALTNPLYVKVP